MSLNESRLRSSVRCGFILEAMTLSWNVIGVAVLAVAAIAARSVALAGFGLDSLIEIGASVVVLWELRAIEGSRRPRALRLIGVAFLALALYLAVQSLVVLSLGFHPLHSVAGIIWTALTAAVMLVLSRAKTRVGRTLGNEVLIMEGRVTLVDAVLAVAVLAGLTLNAGLGWWWADPSAGLVIVAYGVKEGWAALHHGHQSF